MSDHFFYDESGFVYTNPLHDLPISLSIHRPRSENEAKQYAESILKNSRNLLGETAKLGMDLKKTHHLLRKMLLSYSLPDPGLFQLSNGWYTGWYFFSIDNTTSGKRFLPRVTGKTHLYWSLSQEEAQFWQAIIRSRPLSVQEEASLWSAPTEVDHPSYSEQLALSIPERFRFHRDYIDRFWSTFHSMGQLDFQRKAAFVEPYLFDFAVMDIANYVTYREMLSGIVQRMMEAGVTMFPLGNDRCVAVFKSKRRDKPFAYRVLPMPTDKLHTFQRYLFLGQSYMEKDEFVGLYKKLVDSQTKLFE